jgi:hypothetical protein
VERFQSGRTSVIEDCWGNLATSQTAEKVEQVNALVQENRWINGTDIADKFDICCGSTYSIMCEDLGYYKICAKRVAEQLTVSRKRHVWKCACSGLSQEIKYWCTSMNLKQTSKHGVETSPRTKKFKSVPLCLQSAVVAVLVLQRTHP